MGAPAPGRQVKSTKANDEFVKTPAPRHDPGADIERAIATSHGSPQELAAFIQANPQLANDMIHMLQTRFGNAFVQRVLAAAPKTQPSGGVLMPRVFELIGLTEVELARDLPHGAGEDAFRAQYHDLKPELRDFLEVGQAEAKRDVNSPNPRFVTDQVMADWAKTLRETTDARRSFSHNVAVAYRDEIKQHVATLHGLGGDLSRDRGALKRIADVESQNNQAIKSVELVYTVFEEIEKVEAALEGVSAEGIVSGDTVGGSSTASCSIARSGS